MKRSRAVVSMWRTTLADRQERRSPERHASGKPNHGTCKASGGTGQTSASSLPSCALLDQAGRLRRPENRRAATRSCERAPALRARRCGLGAGHRSRGRARTHQGAHGAGHRRRVTAAIGATGGGFVVRFFRSTRPPRGRTPNLRTAPRASSLRSSLRDPGHGPENQGPVTDCPGRPKERGEWFQLYNGLNPASGRPSSIRAARTKSRTASIVGSGLSTQPVS